MDVRFEIEQRAPEQYVFADGAADGIVGDTLLLTHDAARVGTARIVAASIRHAGRALALTLETHDASASLLTYDDLESVCQRYLDERTK